MIGEMPGDWSGLVVLQAATRWDAVRFADQQLAVSDGRLPQVSGDGAALQARLETFAADPGAFAAREGPRPGGWDEHLDRVLGAYDDAGSSREAPNRT